MNENTLVALEIERPALPTVEGGVESLLVTVTSQETAERAADANKTLARLRKEISALCEEPKRQAHSIHTRICAFEKDALGPIEKVEKANKLQIASWVESERKRIAEEDAARVKAEDDARMEEAARLASAGKPEEAEAVLDAPRPPAPPPATPKVQGAGVGRKWSAVVEDFPFFVRWCVANARYDLLEPNVALLNAMATAKKDTAEPPGGIKFTSEVTVSTR